MNKRGRKGITFKLTLITSALLIACTFLILALFYFLLPQFYQQYKINSLNAALDHLIEDARQVTLEEAKPALDAFTDTYNVWLGVQDDNENLVYIPSTYVDNLVLPEAESEDLVTIAKRVEIKDSLKLYSIERAIAFQDGSYNLLASASMQPINEASQVIFLFMPYVAAMVLLISITGAVVYSRFVAKPLIRINRTAKQMVDLNFTSACDVRSDDEIGELSRSLNRLSENLQETMSGLREANEQLSVEIEKERGLEEKRKQFIATISHELKTPITAVMGQIEGMMYQIGAYKDRDKYLSRSFAVMQDMEKLVQELLDISRLENADFEPNWTSRVDLTTVIQDSIRRLEYECGKKQVFIVQELAHSVLIRADRNLIQKALTNIIQNAIQYSAGGEKVIVRLEQHELSNVFQVLNTGVFIQEDQLPELFQPFHRIEKSRNRHTGGSGLGLYIVKQILEVHSAKYSIVNTDRGVLFTVIFPREETLP